eukprot:TRINITY_DN43279_c0_g1_i1.p1 TRINITY_DN43279_c0_g1~~TRINITY_DN43279_c0_g1_i1.p1  ORF type:complete len:368 (-),score=54.48 TRINITY_DN43279_c0_g1_i1:64-1113(-)
MSAPTVCVLGMGAMGADVVRRYRDQGYSVSIWNRTSSKAETVAKEDLKGDCTASDKATDAIALCSADACVISLVLDQATTDSVLRQDGVGAALRGKTFVNLTAGTPDEARQTDWLLKEVTGQSSPKFLDGAISGHNSAAREGKGVTWLSGASREPFDAMCKVIEEMGRSEFVGPLGASKALNFGVTDLLIHSFFSFFSNIWMLEEEGVDMNIFFEEATRKLEAPVGSFQDLWPRMKAMRASGDYKTDPYFDIEVLRTYLEPRKEYERAHGTPFLLNGQCLKVVEEAMGGSPDFPHKGSCMTRIQEVLRYGSAQAAEKLEDATPDRLVDVIKGMSSEDKAKIRAALDGSG